VQSVSYLAALRRRWPLIVVLGLLGLALGYLLAPSTTPSANAAPLDVSHGGFAAHAVIAAPTANAGSTSKSTSSKSGGARASIFFAGEQTVYEKVSKKTGLNVEPTAIGKAIKLTPEVTGGGIVVTGRARTQQVAVNLVTTFINVESNYLDHVAAQKHTAAVKREHGEVKALRSQTTKLQSAAQSLIGETSPSAKLRLARLETKAAALKTTYEKAFSTYETLRSTAAPTGFIVVQQPASLATTSALKTSLLKRKPILMLVGFVLGVAIGVVLSLGLAQIDRRLRSRRQVEDAFRAPVLVEVPRQRLRGTSQDVVVATDPDSQIAESYRQLRTMLVYSADSTRARLALTHATPDLVDAAQLADDVPAADGATVVADQQLDPATYADPNNAVEPPSAIATLRARATTGRSLIRRVAHRPSGGGHVVVVSSASDERIRPTVTANLAVAFSELNLSVLLIRTAASASVVHPDGAPTGPMDVEAVIRPSGLPLVKTLDLTHLAIPLQAGQSITDVVAEASLLADVVVIEAAPVLAAHDVGALSSLADDVLIVAEHGYTTVGAASQAADLLARMNVRVRGIVVTQVPGPKQPRSRRSSGDEPLAQLDLIGEQT
jgi:Mrp family chromosome partitioning ATPase/capsular polysaccharide biosynthesis protein